MALHCRHLVSRYLRRWVLGSGVHLRYNLPTALFVCCTNTNNYLPHMCGYPLPSWLPVVLGELVVGRLLGGGGFPIFLTRRGGLPKGVLDGADRGGGPRRSGLATAMDQALPDVVQEPLSTHMTLYEIGPHACSPKCAACKAEYQRAYQARRHRRDVALPRCDWTGCENRGKFTTTDREGVTRTVCGIHEALTEVPG